jgi:beta-lactamase superfamily II metal-dependent hydrolase
MNEYLVEKRKQTTSFLGDYGKVFFCLIVLITVAVTQRLLFVQSPKQQLRVSFLDVGQGDSILIQTPSGKTMLIDGGPSDVVLARLGSELSYFTTDIDVMEETHPDADHVTGLIPVLEKYTVHTILTTKGIGHTNVFEDLNKHITYEHADVYSAQSGDVIDFHDGVTVRVLYPPAKYVPKKDDTNDASVSTLVTYGDETFLLTGDLPSTEESQLISSGLLQFTKNITVYKAGHHGSKYSSGEQLLSYIHPEYTVISAGKDNKYGHPNGETIERLQKYSKEIISTIDHGTVTFVTDGRLIEMKTTR